MRYKAILLTLTILASSIVITPLANAADKGWRYWGYFQSAHGRSTWVAAMTGPTVDIADGSVEGWSFVFSSNDIPSVAPKVAPSFKAICAKTKADPDTKRIAVVIDFGASAWAPKGEKVAKTITRCVRTAKESQGIDVLGQVVKIRAASSGLICGLNGFPAKECGVEIATPKALVVKK
ncbi:MAG: SCO2322 family protein [Actinomycetota bacterium]|nr:SCO2322 family protein [Actinomycetota bacterium]